MSRRSGISEGEGKTQVMLCVPSLLGGALFATDITDRQSSGEVTVGYAQ
jgi:hypothetical protein